MSDDVRDAVDALVRALSKPREPAPWGWVRCGPTTISTKQAHALARRGELRVTRIGKYCYAAREDLDSIAARNVVTPASANDAAPDPLADLDPKVAARIRAASGAR